MKCGETVRQTPTCGEFISKYLAALLLLTCALSVIPNARADTSVLEVIPLHHRSASELLPLVKGFLAKDGMIQTTDTSLIVRTNPANLIELRRLISQLDTPLRRLLITVKQLSGDAGQNGVSAGDREMSQRLHSDSRSWQTENRQDADRVQQIQVTEGDQAYIDVGRQIPITDFAIAQSRSGVMIKQKTRYVGATTGFYARPRIHGDTVTIEIDPYQTTADNSAAQPSFNVQTLHTTVSGHLDEWIEIAASTASTDNQSGKEITYSTSRQEGQDRHILLRVTVNP